MFFMRYIQNSCYFLKTVIIIEKSETSVHLKSIKSRELGNVYFKSVTTLI